MANIYTAEIPMSDIEKIEIYMNTPSKTVAQIKTATGADYVLNGGLYDMTTWKPVVHLKVNGVVKHTSPYSCYSPAWDTNDVTFPLLPTGGANKKNYIEGVPLVVGGVYQDKLYYDPSVGGKRGRSAIGTNGDKFCLYCTKDGSTNARTPEALRDDIYALGWDNAVMLDGGASSQCNFRGNTITSSRKVYNLILVYLKKNTTSAYTCPYAEPTALVRLGTYGNNARWTQWQLNRFGYGLVVDGIFGAKSVAALKAFQASHGLVVDGISGKLTREKLKG